MLIISAFKLFALLHSDVELPQVPANTHVPKEVAQTVTSAQAAMSKPTAIRRCFQRMQRLCKPSTGSNYMQTADPNAAIQARNKMSATAQAKLHKSRKLR